MGMSSKQVSSDEVEWTQGLFRTSDTIQANPQKQTSSERPPAPALRCPRCDSDKTKFCYYNNYSLSQPRHYCRVCRRHWTHGGALRDVPVGGNRKNKRPKTTTVAITSSTVPTEELNRQPIFQSQFPYHGIVDGQSMQLSPVLPLLSDDGLLQSPVLYRWPSLVEWCVSGELSASNGSFGNLRGCDGGGGYVWGPHMGETKYPF